MLRIAHVIERFGTAGPERSILAAAKYAARAGLGQEHSVCPLTDALSPLALALAKQSGVTVLRTMAAQAELLEDADIVVLHFWNNPALYAWLRGALPPMRLLVWLKIFGSHPPQVIPQPLHAFADLLVATSPGTLALPELAGQPAPPVIYGLADFDRLASCTPQAHAGFVAGYVGGLGPGKLHPDFVPMSAAARIPDGRFIICGSGAEPWRRQAEHLGATARFDFRGHVENIRSVLEVCDVFGYPLCSDTYATSEKALQEAMWVGVPPVVFPHGGVRFLVEDGVTGRVVGTAAEYTAALEALYHEPEVRRRLGVNARAYARAAFDPQPTVNRLAGLFDALMQQPKHTRQWPDDGPTPAHRFAAALGDHAGPFARSLAGRDLQAEAAIAAASDLLYNGEGGIVHYRNAYPDDPYLRLWTGLVLRQRGQIDQADAEFTAGGWSG